MSIRSVIQTYSLVEGFRLVSQMLRLCHKIIQFLSSFQQTFHGVVLQTTKYLFMKQQKHYNFALVK